MADSVAIVRYSNGKVIGSQRKKIIKNLGSSKLSGVNKRTIVRWLAPQPTVTSGSSIETALVASQAIHAIW